MDLDIARKHLYNWMEAEMAVASNQSYTIGSRSLTRANLSEIGERIEYWDKKVKELERANSGKGRNKIFYGVPM